MWVVLGRVLIAGVYFSAAKLGLMLAAVHPSASPVWPPTGIAIATLLLFGNRLWPGIFLGAFTANMTTEGNVWTSLGIATGNTLEGVLGAFLVNRFAGGLEVFERPVTVCKFAVLAALLSPIVSATMGISVLSLGGFADWSNFWGIWLTWWLGDATGAVLFTPFLLLWIQDRFQGFSAGRLREVASLIAVTAAIGYVIFGGILPGTLSHYPIGFLCFPPILWAAFRFLQKGATAVALLIALFALAGTLHGSGPFTNFGDPNVSLIFLQSFLAVLMFTGLILAAAVCERNKVEETLRQRSAELERLSRVKDDFVTMVSHELRSPLTAVTEGIHLVEEERVPENQKETLTIVRRNLDRLVRLVNNILEFQTLDSGLGPLHFGRHDLGLIGQEVADTIRLESEKKGVRLVAEGLGQEEMDCDADRIRQVLINLLGNAVKFTPRGGTVTLRMKSLGEEVRLEVQDTGIGVRPEDGQKIFEMFGQAELGKSRKAGGFGVGLAICRQIVEQHKGRIWAEGAGGKGSLFVVLLPKNRELR